MNAVALVVQPIAKLEAIGFKSPNKTMVKCESNEEWGSLPYRADIDDIEHTKDCWNSIEGVCYYLPIN